MSAARGERGTGRARRGARLRSPVVAASTGALLLWAGALAAQTTDTVPTDSVLVDSAIVIAAEATLPALGGTSPPLPVEHWAARAAARAWSLGLAPGYFPAQRSVPRAQVARALRDAAERAPDQSPALAEVAAGWLRRFEEEFPEYAGAARWPLLGSSAGLVTEHAGGRLEPASGAYGHRREPFGLEPESDVAGFASLAAGLRSMAAIAEVRAGTDGARVPLWDVSASLGRFAAAVGREPVGYGTARGGGIVLSGAAPITRAQLQTTEPVRLPSVLRYLGGTTFHTSLARLPESRHPGRPWLWTARAGFQPHGRLQLGVNRASIFGGDSISTPTTAGNVAKMLLGILSKDFENQIVAADARWRLPTEHVLPATVYFEWGSEDASGAWWTVPGNTFGLFLPRLGSSFAGGAEFTRFATQCCGNPSWYMHASQRGGWVYDHRPLGHPLGGEGWEAMAYGQADLLDSRLRIESRAFVRRRGEEGLARPERVANLYAPDRTGGSVGGSLDAAWRLAPRTDARVSLYGDAGDGWRERTLRAQLSYLF